VTNKKPPHVLIVDDDSLILEELAANFHMRGYDVTTASNGLEALIRLRDAPDVTVVLSDDQMMGLDGQSLARTIRRRWPDANAVEVVILSAIMTDTTASRAHHDGAAFCLDKLVPMRRIAEFVQTAHEMAMKRRLGLAGPQPGSTTDPGTRRGCQNRN